MNMASASTSQNGPLSHLRVLDLTQFLSGPFGTQILADLGAEVIKVEPPEGDMTRRLPPHFVDGESAYYLSVNRNKKSLAVNMKTPEGQQLVRDLALACDVVIENFRPGVLARLGIEYEEIAAEKPEIVWASISGFGQNGPYRDRPAYDMIVQALSGGMSMTGEPDGKAVRSGIPLADLSAGLYAVIGILAAVTERQVTGRGRRIDVSMLDCQVAMLCYQAAYHLHSGDIPLRQGSGHDSIPTYRSFACGDGNSLVITANTERMWQRLCGVLDLDDLIEHSHFRTNSDRYAHREELWALLEERFLAKDAAVWVPLLLKAEIPAAVVNTLDRSLADPQVLHRNMVLSLQNENGTELRVAGNPIKISGVGEHHSYPPSLAADESALLDSILGLNEASIASLRRAGALGGETPASAATAEAKMKQSARVT